MELRREWQKKLYEAGYLGMDWPPEWGGRGATEVEKAIFEEEMARADAPPILNFLGIGLLGPALIHHGSEEQRRRFIPPMLSADEIWCQGFSEPGAGSDLAALRTSADLDGDDFVLNGQKIWTTFGPWADWIFVLARTDSERSLRRHLVHPLQARHARRHRAPAPADHRRERVRRGVLRGRARAAREPGRPDRRGLAHRDDRAGVRARRRRRSAYCDALRRATSSCWPRRCSEHGRTRRRGAREARRACWSRTRSCAPTASARSPTSPTARCPAPSRRSRRSSGASSTSASARPRSTSSGPAGSCCAPVRERAARRRLGARVPLVARRHDLLRLLRDPAQHHRQAGAQPAAGRPMKFELSEDQALLRTSTRDFLASEWPLEKSAQRDGARAARLRAGATGSASPRWATSASSLPANVGGQGLGAIELAIVLEEMGRVCMPGPVSSTSCWRRRCWRAAGGQDALLQDIVRRQEARRRSRATTRPSAAPRRRRRASKAVASAAPSTSCRSRRRPTRCSSTTPDGCVWSQQAVRRRSALQTIDLAQRFGEVALDHPATRARRRDVCSSASTASRPSAPARCCSGS